MVYYLRIHCCDKTLRPNATWGRNSLFHLVACSYHAGKSGGNLEAGTDTEAMKRYCLLTGSLWLAQLLSGMKQRIPLYIVKTGKW